MHSLTRARGRLLKMLAFPPGLLGQCLLSPLLLPLARSPREERRRFALALPDCPLLLPPLRGPDSEHRSQRVPPTANICGGFWLFTSGGARALRPEGVGPPGRTRPGAVLVDDTLALPLPVPARAPLLAQLGVLACEAAFPTLSSVGLQLPVFPRVPFLACELAFLVCTVQIKVVSI